jgi:hypothetical protein
MRNPSQRYLDRRSFLQGTILTAGVVPSGVQSLVQPLNRSDSAQTLEIIAEDKAELYYRFTVEGNVEKTRTSNTVKAGRNDPLTTGNNKATTTVRGFTGNPGNGDAYEVTGTVRSFQQTGGTSDFRILLDGREVSPRDLGGPDRTVGSLERINVDRPMEGTLEIVATEPAELYYDFTVEGDVEKTKTSNAVKAGRNDPLTTGNNKATTTVRGFTGNPGNGDAYEIDGTFNVFRRTGGNSDFFFRFNDERLTPNELARVNVKPASDCVLNEFKKYSGSSSRKFTDRRDELVKTAQEAKTNRMLSRANILAIDALETIARVHYGDYLGGAQEFLDLMDRSTRILAEETNHPMYQSLWKYTQTAQFVYGLLHNSDNSLQEYVELVEEAYGITQDRDEESMRAAMELALKGYTGRFKKDVTNMTLDIADLPLESTVTGLKINAQGQLMLKIHAECQLPILDELARLTEYRTDGKITEQEMYGHFACRQELWLARLRLSEHIHHLERVGRKKSLVFRLSRDLGELLGMSDVLKDSKTAAKVSRRTYNQLLKELALFRKGVDSC